MNGNKIIVLNLKSNANDYRRVLFWHYREFLFLNILLTVLSIFAAIYLIDVGGSNSLFESKNSSSFQFFILLLILPFILACITYLEIWRKAKRNEKLKEPTEMTFTEEGLNATTKSNSFQIGWNGFKKIIETSKDFIFFPQETAFFSIPKRFFNTDSQMEELKNLIRRYLNDKAKLKS